MKSQHKIIATLFVLTATLLAANVSLAQGQPKQRLQKSPKGTVAAPQPKAKAAAPAPKAAARPAIPYDFKSISLGISVAEFKAKPYPETDRGSSISPVCTGDIVAQQFSAPSDPREVRVYDLDKELGVVKCIFWGPTTIGGTTRSYSEKQFLRLGGGIYGSYTYEFEFYPDDAGVPRLYKIVLPSNVDALPDILPALTQKFGSPRVVPGQMQTRAGATFDKSSYYWDNGVSRILLETRFTAVDDLVIIYTLSELAAKKNAVTEAKQAAVPNRM
jgi:hypothetical protein